MVFVTPRFVVVVLACAVTLRVTASITTDDDALFDRAMHRALAAGFTFDTLTSSYGRLLGSLLNLGFAADEANRLIPMFAAKKGVVLSANPMREDAEPCEWALDLPAAAQMLADALAARHVLLADFFEEMGWRDGRDGHNIAARDLRKQFDIPVAVDLATIWKQYQAAVHVGSERSRKMSDDERRYVDRLRGQTFDYQAARWARQCQAATDLVAAAHEQSFPGNPTDTQHLEDALSDATAAALRLVARRGLATVIGSEVLSLLPNGFFNEFRKVTVVAPEVDVTSVPHAVHSSEDVTRSICALYHALRRHLNDVHDRRSVHPTMEYVRKLLLHFRSSVQRVTPQHVAALLNADVAVLLMHSHRIAPTVGRLVYSEMKREFRDALGATFDEFYRSVFEELTFFSKFAAQMSLRALARDVPEGSAVVVVFPTTECRISATGGDEDCLPVYDSMADYTRVLSDAAVFSASSNLTLPADGHVVSAPRDTPTRARAGGSVRLHVRVEVHQWGNARGLDDEEAPPFFGDDIADLMAAEAAAQRPPPQCNGPAGRCG